MLLAITNSAMFHAQVTGYDIGYAVDQLAMAFSKPAKAHMATAKRLLRYLAELPTVSHLEPG